MAIPGLPGEFHLPGKSIYSPERTPMLLRVLPGPVGLTSATTAAASGRLQSRSLRSGWEFARSSHSRFERPHGVPLHHKHRQSLWLRRGQPHLPSTRIRGHSKPPIRACQSRDCASRKASSTQRTPCVAEVFLRGPLLHLCNETHVIYWFRVPASDCHEGPVQKMKWRSMHLQETLLFAGSERQIFKRVQSRTEALLLSHVRAPGTQPSNHAALGVELFIALIMWCQSSPERARP